MNANEVLRIVDSLHREKNIEKLQKLERALYRQQRRLRRNPEDAESKTQVEKLQKEIEALTGPIDPSLKLFKSPPTHNTNGYTSYTPVSDGKNVFASFGIGVVVSYDLAGELQWATRLDNPDHNWGGASSPILAGNTLVVRFSDWVGLDPTSGKEKWRVPTEITFNCPAVFQVEGTDYLFSARGQLIRAEDGKLLPSPNFTQVEKPWAFFNTCLLYTSPSPRD